MLQPAAAYFENAEKPIHLTLTQFSGLLKTKSKEKRETPQIATSSLEIIKIIDNVYCNGYFSRMEKLYCFYLFGP